MCNYTLTIPSQDSINLSTAVALIGYEIWKQITSNKIIKARPNIVIQQDPRASQEMIQHLTKFVALKMEEKGDFEADKTSAQLQTVFTKNGLTEYEVRFLYSVLKRLTSENKP